jgi:pimeloyl-ACP methyl ester carboxylesterase
MDQRGIGLSDRMTQVIDLETRMDDVRAVLDAVGSERTVLYGQGLDGGAICAMFAATYPERTAGLLLWSGQACGFRDADYPWAASAEENEAFDTRILETWAMRTRSDRSLPRRSPLVCGGSGKPEGVGAIHAVRREPRRCLDP